MECRRSVLWCFGWRVLVNWTFNVGVSRGENDALTANRREPSYATADEQQGEKGKIKHNFKALLFIRKKDTSQSFSWWNSPWISRTFCVCLSISMIEFPKNTTSTKPSIVVHYVARGALWEAGKIVNAKAPYWFYFLSRAASLFSFPACIVKLICSQQAMRN